MEYCTYTYLNRRQIMIEVYWISLIIGISFALITLIFDDIIGNFLDGFFDFSSVDGIDFLNPLELFGAITTFGGAGILLTDYTSISPVVIFILSMLIAATISIFLYFFYVKPMKNADNSTGYSIMELEGKIGEVITPVPEKGYGEILIRAGAYNTNQIAASYDGVGIQSGARVVVIEVKEGVLFVSRFEDIIKGEGEEENG